jgi:hypothetical protein
MKKSMVGEVSTVRSSDTDTDLPIVSADLFQVLEETQSLHRFKLADFEAIQSLHRLEIVYSNKICCFIAPKWRILKRYNRFIDCNLFLIRKLCRFLASNWRIFKRYNRFID